MKALLAIRGATSLLGIVLASTAFALGPRDIDALPASPPTATFPYGPGPFEFGELRMPEGPGPFPLAIIIHGGCWTKGFATLRNTAPIATALVRRGIATWNVEYRQAGDEGAGWPGTFRDWSAAADYVRVLAKTYPIDLDRVVVTGHSAGAHAALWVAARPRLPTDSVLRTADPLKVRGAIAIDGPGDPAGFVGLDARICGKPVMAAFMDATPEADPDRYRQASPQDMLPLGMPQVMIAARVLLPDAAREYARQAEAKGDRVEVIELETGHFEPIAPGEEAWRRVEAAIVRLATSP